MRKAHIFLLTMLIYCLCLFLISACQREKPDHDNRSTTPSAAPLPSTAPSPTSTLPAPKVLIISSQDIAIDPYLTLYSRIESLSTHEGWNIEQHKQLDPSLLSTGTRLVVLFSPEAAITEFVNNHPEIPFVTIGLSGIQPGPNLSVIGPDGYRIDQQAFAAGYLSAVITKDWRIGALIQEESEISDHLIQAFSNGVIYYCGLCRSYYPPFYQYPIAIRIPAQATEADWINATQQLLKYEVETVFIYANDIHQAAMEQFHKQNVKLIGNHYPSIGTDEQWAATLRFAPEIALEENWDEIVYGESNISIPLMTILDNVNPTLVSQGRENWVQYMLDDLIASFIDTGVVISDQTLP